MMARHDDQCLLVGQMPPQELAMEQAVLGAMLISAPALNEVRDFLVPADFYHSVHGIIFAAICDAYRYDGAVDALTVGAFLKDVGQLDAVGGVVYLATIEAQVATGANVMYHARRVKEVSIRRRLIDLCSRTSQICYDGTQSASEAADSLLAATIELSRSGERDRAWRLREIAANVEEEYQRAKRSERQWAGLDSGFPDLNDALNGLCPHELTAVGADTGVGKTRLAMQIVRHAASHGEGGALIFSLEMTKEQTYRYISCFEANIPWRAFLRGALTQEEESRLRERRATIDQWPVYVHAYGGLTLERLYAETERILGIDKSVHLVIIDYVQIMDGPGSSQNDRLVQITKGLKEFKRRYPVHVLALSQLSRSKLEERPDRYPRGNDLKDCGAIQEACDNALLIWRPSVYQDMVQRLQRKAREKAWSGERLQRMLSRVDLIASKVRFDSPAIIPLVWDGGQFHSHSFRGDDGERSADLAAWRGRGGGEDDIAS